MRASTTSGLNASFSERPAWGQLQEVLEARRRASEPVADLKRFEDELHALFAAAEAEAIGSELGRFDIDLPFVEIEGRRHRRVLRCEQTYWTAAGEIRVERSLYSTRHDGEHAVAALDLRAGIIEGRWTPRAAEQALWVVGHLTPQTAETLFKKIGNLQPSKSSLDRLPKALSECWERRREEFETALRQSERVPKEATAVAVSLDGVMAPMKRTGARKERRAQTQADGKHLFGPAGFHEVGVGTVSLYDAEGNLLKTTRFSRMPEANKLTIKQSIEAELQTVLRQHPDLQVIKIADGVPSNWAYFRELQPDGRQVVDFYHAVEHLHSALQAAYGEISVTTTARCKQLRHILLEDQHGVEKVIRALRHLRNRYPRRARIAKSLDYFCRHRNAMRYAALRADNLPIGSGVVEAACKTLVVQRLRCSGMRWSHAGGQAILTIRGWQQSARFDRAWQLLASTYKKNVSILDNVIDIRVGHR